MTYLGKKGVTIDLQNSYSAYIEGQNWKKAFMCLYVFLSEKQGEH